MGEAKRRGTQKQRQAKRVIVKGWLKLGPDYAAGVGDDGRIWRGWRVHADPGPDMEPVTIIKGHK